MGTGNKGREMAGEKTTLFALTRGPVRLSRLLGEGGEGRIYLVEGQDLACKVYFPDRVTEDKRKKLFLMLEKPVRQEGVCWPLDMVDTAGGRFAGYLMERAQGVPMQRGMFLKQLLMQHFPTWTRKHLVELALTVLLKIQFLHRNNVLLGDISPLNILISSEKAVYFVDTDSFQVGDYPCPVGTVTFTPPELQGKNFATFLRRPEHEYFAVATLLFMILLPGKPPYSMQGGGNPGENIMKQEFSYPFRSNTNGKTPLGPWRFIWSNLPYRTKESFYECFAQGKRYAPEDWINVLEGYRSDLAKGHVSDEIFPTTLKKINEHAVIKFGAKDLYEVLICPRCSGKFSSRKRQASEKRAELLCPECIMALREKAAN